MGSPDNRISQEEATLAAEVLATFVDQVQTDFVLPVYTDDKQLRCAIVAVTSADLFDALVQIGLFHREHQG